ncbi:MAG: extracellular solute-binding protein [Bauldia sp.]
MSLSRGGLTRRGAIAAAGASAAAGLIPLPFAWAAGRTGLHGLSVFGELKYPPDFKHFDYITADAPKAGRMNFAPPNRGYNQSFETFNTLNSFVLKGAAPPRIELTFDSLMTRAADEPEAVYGLVAESVDVSDDGSLFTFRLRPEARFNNGTPLTAEDVAYSLTVLKEKGHPTIVQPLGPMVKAEATDAHSVAVRLDEERTRDTILTIVELPIFSKAYYANQDFEASTLAPPLGSGPYRVGRMSAGRFIEYERVADYWGNDLPVNIGHFNFDVIRTDFYTERQAAFEAFKKGEITHREEFTSITWAQGYGFPAVIQGRVKKSTDFPSEKRPSHQGWYINTRRGKLRDPRTRQGIGLAFDFEWSNKNLFFDSYVRQTSIFGDSDYAATGTPSAAERAILEPFRSTLPAEIFGEAYVPPKTDGSGRDRAMLKRAADLLAAAGWRQIGNDLVDEEGAPFELEFLIDAQVFERILSPYVQNLKALGINASIRQVDPVQAQARENDFDYDIVLQAFSFAATPIDGLAQFYGSRAAATPGSRNYSGVKEPAIDAALDRLPSVTTREELIAVTRVIDRVFRAGHYWTPAWSLANHRLAYWDVFGWPPTKPDFAFTPETTWWFDKDRAKAIGYTG